VHPPDGGITCDGNAGDNDVGKAIAQAQESGIAFVIGAGDAGNESGCTVHSLAEAPSALVVGALEHGCDDTNYGTSACTIWDNSSTAGSGRGGMTATIDSSSYGDALSLVGVVAPGAPTYVYSSTGDTAISAYTGSSWIIGTSYANPLVAGAGVVFKDYMLYNGHTTVNSDGILTTLLLAMGDRSSGTMTSGYSDVWGGGRFQMQNLSNLGSPWAWGTLGYTATATNQSFESDVQGSGNEPTGIGLFKAYMLFLEEDNSNMADVDLSVYDGNCSGSRLGIDQSRDVHSMVYVDGSLASGQALCTKVSVYYMPPMQSRDVRLFRYFSGSTTMR
jgi:hypothetical protein